MITRFTLNKSAIHLVCFRRPSQTHERKLGFGNMILVVIKFLERLLIHSRIINGLRRFIKDCKEYFIQFSNTPLPPPRPQGGVSLYTGDPVLGWTKIPFSKGNNTPLNAGYPVMD